MVTNVSIPYELQRRAREVFRKRRGIGHVRQAGTDVGWI